VTSEPRESEPGWLRLSPRSLVVRPVMDLVRLLPFLLGLLYLHSRGGGTDYWGLVFAAFAVTTSIVRWLTTRYRVTDERVYVRHGLLNQKVLSVARDRIRTVDLSAHLPYRMLGLRRVAIGTGRNDRREGESFRLDALTLADAEALRATLLAAAAAIIARPPVEQMTAESAAAQSAAAQPAAAQPAMAQPAPAQPAIPQPVIPQMALPQPALVMTPQPAAAQPAAPERAAAWTAGAQQQAPAEAEISRLHPAWIRFAPLTLTGMVIISVIFGFAVQFSDAAHINLAAIGPVHRLGIEFSALPLGSRITTATLVAAGFFVLISTAGYTAVFWNFRLTRQPEGTLRVTRGLFSTRATTIDLRRLRGVEISEPLLLRAAKGARCIAITTGLRVGHGAERGGSVLLPPAPRAAARAVAADVLAAPEELCTGPLIPHGPRARRRRYNRAVAGAAVIVAAVAAASWLARGPAWIWTSSLVLLPASAALAADRYQSLGHRLTGGWLVTRTGSLVRRRAVLSTEGIIGWRIHQSWFQRQQGLVTLTAVTAAGRQHYSAYDVPADEALSVAEAATGDLIRPFLAADRAAIRPGPGLIRPSGADPAARSL
jgi:putative membrane protein